MGTTLFRSTIHQFNATQAGLFMLLPAIAFAVASPVAGRIFDKLGIRNLYIVSGIGLFISSWSMAFATEAMPIWAVIVLYCLRNGSLGLLMMPLTTWGMGALKKEQIAQGTAIMNALRNIAGAIGSAVVIGFMATVTKLTAASPHAAMYGFNGAFAFVGLFTVFMMVIAVFFVKPGKN